MSSEEGKIYNLKKEDRLLGLLRDMGNAATMADELSETIKGILKDYMGQMGVEEQLALSRAKRAANGLSWLLREAEIEIETGPTVGRLFHPNWSRSIE